MFDPEKVTGVIRSSVQAFFASLIVTLLPVLERLDIVEEVSNLAAVLTSLIVGLVLGAYWFLLNWAQTSPKVQSNPVLKFVVDMLMGGSKTPTYVE